MNYGTDLSFSFDLETYRRVIEYSSTYLSKKEQVLPNIPDISE